MVFDTSEDRHRSTHTHSQMVIASQWQMDCPFHFEQHEEWVVHIHSGRLEQNRAAPSQQWCHLQKSQSRHIWQRRVGRPDEKSIWIVINDEIFSCNRAGALTMQQGWLTDDSSHEGIMRWQNFANTIHACGCGKSLMSFFVTCHLSGRHTARY